MASTISTTAGEWARGTRGDRRFLEADQLFFVPRLLWVTAALATLTIPNPRTAVLCVSVLSVAWTIIQVQRRGGPYLTPSGVYFLASGVFVGIAGWYLLSVETVETPMYHLRAAVVLAFILTVATEAVASWFCVRWRVSWRMPSRSERQRVDFQPPKQFALRGILLLGVSRVPQVVSLNYELATAIGLAGVLILALNSVSLRHQIKWLGDILIVLSGVVLPLVWVSTVFRGGGRLIVAGVGVALIMLWNLVRASGWQKLAAVLAIPVFLMAMGISRLDKIESEYGVTRQADGTSVISSGAGLESVYDPLDKFGVLMSQQEFIGGTLGPRWGATFFNTMVMPVPRSYWEGKPKGFGAELTELIAPDMVSRNQSYAALGYSEWYANFGYAGLVAVPFAIGFVLAALDRVHARLVASRLRTNRDWWHTVILVCVTASLGELFWSGTFTFYTRGGMAALIAWAVGALSMRRLRPGREAAGPDSDADEEQALEVAPRRPGSLGVVPRPAPLSVSSTGNGA